MLSHLALTPADDAGGVETASWDVVLVAPGASPTAATRLADVDAERRSGRLELTPAAVPEGGDARGRVHAVWTGVEGVMAARIDVLPRDPVAPLPD